ncbi:hypothetical protein HOLleu_43757 [Holothuria leucospilota]|uniref:Uncharacterized protein n=1 Tax=Holothuria leucospilota TaxID=206669 RepID=A0A9Q1BAV9_HOLLE|nr:hypothetical protein HOLleu_43757 [Holothuria leucospilota]
MGISETHWTGQGRVQLAEGKTIVYSGRDDDNHRQGDVLNKRNAHDMLIITGDMNAKEGDDNQNYDRIMGRHGMGERNDKNVRLCDMLSLRRQAKEKKNTRGKYDMDKLKNGDTLNTLKTFSIALRRRYQVLEDEGPTVEDDYK